MRRLGCTKGQLFTPRIQAEDAWRRARLARDVAFRERFYAKEARIQGMDGKALTREADIAMFKTGQIKPKFITHGPLDIRTYGEVAVVTGVDHLGGTAFGRYGEMYLRWQLIVQQATRADGF